MTQHDQVRTLMTEGDHLDDITRARMWSRIEGALATPAAPRKHARTFALVAGALAVAATAILIVRGVGARGAREMSVAADATLTSHLGPHARAALVGPARLELLGPPGDATTAQLHAGTLLAEFEGGHGRSLRIVAGDLTIDIVGTLFAVEIRDDDRACVAVSHGTVRVTRRAGVQLVTDRQELCSGDAGPHAIPPETEQALERHERTISIASAHLRRRHLRRRHLRHQHLRR